MLQLSKETILAFDARMERRRIPRQERPAFRKWSRYYLDFCDKYRLEVRRLESLPVFLSKLQAKDQTAAQQG